MGVYSQWLKTQAVGSSSASLIEAAVSRRGEIPAVPVANSSCPWMLLLGSCTSNHFPPCSYPFTNLNSNALWPLFNTQVKVYATKYVGHGRRLAEKAARNGADLVGAVGGDGTLNEVIDGIMRAGVMGPDGLPRAVVTVLPLGTASDFHRSMAWEPYDFEEAMWRIGKRGETAVLDVARIRCASPEGIKERHFINIASCGASARAALKVDRWRWLGQKSSYRMAAVAALFRYMPRNLAVRVNNGEWTKAAGTTMIAIGNGSYFGCGINMCPDANPYDGELQVVKAKRMGVCDFLFRRHRLKIGRHLDMKGFSAENASRIDVALWDNRRRGPKETLGMFGNTSMTNTYDSSPGDASPEPSFTTQRTESAETPSPAERASSSRGQLEYSPSGSERSARSASGRSLSTLSSSMTRSGSAAGRKNGKKELKEADYGPVPVEVDGEVIGHVPFSVTVLPGAIKFRVSGFRTDE